MSMLSLNKSKLVTMIEGFNELYDKEPYLICSQKTFDDFMRKDKYIMEKPSLQLGTITITGDMATKNNLFYLETRVLIDNDLTYGEVLVR